MATSEKKQLTGACLCGAVHLRATPEKLHADACHCATCRQWSGGPFLSIGCGADVAIERGEGVVTLFESSEWAQRGFCSQCGTHLFFRMREPVMYFVSGGLFGDVEGLAFTTEIFIDSKPGWYSFANDTRKMTGEDVVAAFASG